MVAGAASPVVVYPDLPLVLIHGCPPDNDAAQPCPVCPNVSTDLVTLQALHGLAVAGVDYDAAEVAAAVDRVMAEADTFRASVASFYAGAAVDPLADTLVLEPVRILEHAGAPAPPSWPASSSPLALDDTQPVPALDDTQPVPRLDLPGPVPVLVDGRPAELVVGERRRPRLAWLLAAVSAAAAVVTVLTGAPAVVVHGVRPQPYVEDTPAAGGAGELVDDSGGRSQVGDGERHDGERPASSASPSPAPSTSPGARPTPSHPSSPRPATSAPAAAPAAPIRPSTLPDPSLLPVDPVPSDSAPSLPVDPSPLPVDPIPSDSAPSLPPVDAGDAPGELPPGGGDDSGPPALAS